MLYRQRPSSVGGAVVWSLTVSPAGAARVLPDGCMDLILLGGELCIAGPDTRSHVPTVTAGDVVTGIRFPPGVAPAVLGLPADELRDLRLPLADVWGAGTGRRLSERLTAAPDAGRVLERIAAHRLRTARPDPLAAFVAGQLDGGERVAQLARTVGLSDRQLHRRCLRAFGYGPKTLARILRMRRALDSARAGTPPADVAVETGYADQAHLSREIKALAGVPLSALLPTSDG
ncbi:helix-turn-helix transcriptional regulator [Saccharomonospora halophila]|uniref:helix-turn-helix transcriptional regulator n=1 Tax=Saccharomonospora halophila TaxID=129922 RepID=UPI0003787275|nr:AraC family transcriptional regulator [Saccharomonospora halophila]